MHNLSFTALDKNDFSVKTYLVNYQRSMTRENFRFTQIKKGIGSTRQGIVETYTTSFNRKYHQLENRAWLRKQRIQFTKSIMYPRKNSQGY